MQSTFPLLDIKQSHFHKAFEFLKNGIVAYG